MTDDWDDDNEVVLTISYYCTMKTSEPNPSQTTTATSTNTNASMTRLMMVMMMLKWAGLCHPQSHPMFQQGDRGDPTLMNS
jgi:hypothetical protein